MTTPTTHPQTLTSPSRPKDVINPPQAQQTELFQILNILTLAYHRNKNQHRRSRWWKELSLLRRNLRRLLAQSESESEPEPGKEGFEKRARFLREWLLSRCWVAFSGLVGDNQYAALGLMLLGTLARLGRVLGLDFKNEVAVGGVDVRGGSERGEDVVELGHGSGWVDEDLGVPLAREEMVETEAQSKADEKEYARSDGGAAAIEEEKLSAKKKRRKKHHDAIDELFSGLL